MSQVKNIEGRENIVRDRILRFLFDHRNRRTKGYKTTEIERTLKDEGIKAGEVRANLPYLLDNEWVAREERDRTFRSPKGTMQNATEVKYRISAKGVDLVNGQGSPYSQNANTYAGIHIENVSGVVMLGDHNVASVKAVDVVRPLDNLAKAVEESAELSDSQKHDYSSELATLRAALSKQEPNKSVIKLVVDSLGPLANVATIAGFVQTMTQALHAAGLL